MNLGIPPLKIKIMLESNPLKSTMLVGRLGVQERRGERAAVGRPLPHLGDGPSRRGLLYYYDYNRNLNGYCYDYNRTTIMIQL